MNSNSLSECDCSLTEYQAYHGKDKIKTFSDESGPGKSRLTVQNEYMLTYCLYSVDKKLLKEMEGEKACDYLLIVPAEDSRPSQAFLVELKGKHVKIGLEQLYQSLDRLKDRLQPCKCLYAVLVTNSGLNVRDPEYLKQRIKFKAKRCELLPPSGKPLAIPQSTPATRQVPPRWNLLMGEF